MHTAKRPIFLYLSSAIKTTTWGQQEFKWFLRWIFQTLSPITKSTSISPHCSFSPHAILNASYTWWNGKNCEFAETIAIWIWLKQWVSIQCCLLCIVPYCSHNYLFSLHANILFIWAHSIKMQRKKSCFWCKWWYFQPFFSYLKHIFKLNLLVTGFICFWFVSSSTRM